MSRPSKCSSLPERRRRFRTEGGAPHNMIRPSLALVLVRNVHLGAAQKGRRAAARSRAAGERVPSTAGPVRSVTSGLFVLPADAGGAAGGVGGAVGGVSQLRRPGGSGGSLQPCAAHHHRQHVLPCDSGRAAAGSCPPVPLVPPVFTSAGRGKSMWFLGLCRFSPSLAPS